MLTLLPHTQRCFPGDLSLPIPPCVENRRPPRRSNGSGAAIGFDVRTLRRSAGTSSERWGYQAVGKNVTYIYIYIHICVTCSCVTFDYIISCHIISYHITCFMFLEIRMYYVCIIVESKIVRTTHHSRNMRVD